MNSNTDNTGVDLSSKQDGGTDNPTPPAARDERGRLLPGSKLNPEGTGGFQDRPEDRSNGSWKKEDTPRGKLEKLLSETTLGEFMEQIKETNKDTNVNEKLGDVLLSGRLANAIVADPDNAIDGKIKVNSKELDSLLYFVYGSKSENDTNIRTEDGVNVITGFVLPTAPKDFIDEHGNQTPQE